MAFPPFCPYRHGFMEKVTDFKKMIKAVIARRSKATTWQSQGSWFLLKLLEIATGFALVMI